MHKDLRSKLQLYKKDSPPKSKKELETGSDIHDIMGGVVLSNDNGSCFVIENRLPISYLYGGYPLGNVLNIDPLALKRVCRDISEKTCVSDLLFLDTETTGLSSGTGTVAFLVGVGFFEDDAFVLRQYFMRDYDEEPALLTEINDLFGSHSSLVTFNGKSFDWNLLKTRFIFNRIRPAISEPAHIDLLFPSRRIWKLKLESCRLQSIEENILGETRVDDIPGAQIPSIYFEYLNSRNAGIIKKVIKHNELDILSMVALLSRISNLLDEPLEASDGEHELLGIGKIFESSREFETVIECFENCMKSENVSVKEAAMRRLSDIYKKSGDYKKAVRHWECMLSASKGSSIFPMIELAKYYEHKEKNIIKALEIVEEAIIICLRTGILKNTYYEDLKKRKNRLKRKAGRE